MSPFGSFNSELDVEGGSLSMLGASATGHNLTLGGGGTYRAEGSPTELESHGNGVWRRERGGTLTVTGTTTITGSADKFLAAPYQLNLEGSGSWFGSGNLHALAPSSSTSSFLIQNFGAFSLSGGGGFVVNPSGFGTQYVVWDNVNGFPSSGSLTMTVSGHAFWQAGLRSEERRVGKGGRRRAASAHHTRNASLRSPRHKRTI